MAATKEEVFRLIRENKQTLIAFGASRIGLFGSFARGAANDTSDIDLLIEFEPGKKTFKNYTGAYLFLKELLQRKIDFITPESLSPYIGNAILNSVEYVTFD